MKTFFIFSEISKNMGRLCFLFKNGTLKKSGLVGRWETKQFIGMALVSSVVHYMFVMCLLTKHEQYF